MQVQQAIQHVELGDAHYLLRFLPSIVGHGGLGERDGERQRVINRILRKFKRLAGNDQIVARRGRASRARAGRAIAAVYAPQMVRW